MPALPNPGGVNSFTFNIPIAINVFPQQHPQMNFGIQSGNISKEPSFRNLFASLQTQNNNQMAS
jgi:hypothetical protein